ncbi:hypothetical protein FMGBMHLM_4473 [Methylobacterium aerolatum]|nr:hypothetical protein FMGBMHLM_4473 [Methylobacterium aerolatum]
MSAITKGSSAKIVFDLIIVCCERRLNATKIAQLVECVFDEGSVCVASALTQTDGSGDRLTAARMSVAGLVQTKGLARRLCSAM